MKKIPIQREKMMREYGSEFALESGNRIFERVSTHSTLLTFRSCRDACTALAAKIIAKGFSSILFPALCCDSMYMPFENQGLTVVFYDIDSSFNPVLPKKIPQNCAVFLMNYYGVHEHRNLIFSIKESNPKTQVILDLTHVPYDDLWLTEGADYYVASLRKTFPIINGGLLVTNETGWQRFPYVKNKFSDLRKEGMKKKFDYLHNKNSDTKNAFRSLLKSAETAIGMGEEAIGADTESTDLIHSINAEGICVARRKNYAKLYTAIEDCRQIKIYTPKHIKYTPFSLPIFFRDQYEAQKRLADNGVYAPILWPLSDRNRKISSFAAEFEKHALSLPIDQRYDYDDMEEIARIIRSIT